MVDQDGVVCDKSYQTTKDISQYLKDCLDETTVLVPNSDTPIERLRGNFQVMLGITPQVVIGELGATVRMYDREIFQKEILGRKEHIAHLKKFFEKNGAHIETGDSATWIREGKKFRPNSRLIIFDGMREQTVAFYVRHTNEGGIPEIQPQWAREALAILSQIPLPTGLKEYDYNPKYGIAISNVFGADKTSGYRGVRGEFPDAEFYMIGDGDIDIIQDPKVTHCAVGNASPALKQISKYVSPVNVTGGLEDCLRWIFSQQK